VRKKLPRLKAKAYKPPAAGVITRTGNGHLYQIKGRRWIRCIIVPVNPIVMNSGDVFV